TAWDLAIKIDLEAFNLMQGGTINGKNYGVSVYGNFTTTGANLNRSWMAHARIVAANLPTKNDYANTDLDDYSASPTPTFFRLAVIRKIMAYCDAWGNVWGTAIRPTGAIL